MKQTLTLWVISVILFSSISVRAQNPTLQWSTFQGGDLADDGGIAVALDKNGNIYVLGNSFSSWGSPINSYSGNRDAFVAKLNGSGVLEWSTFLGSTDTDTGRAIALDGSGNIYIAGESWATWGTPKNPFAGFVDAFLAKLDSTGTLQWNTFLGGKGDDDCRGIKVEENGTVYVAGDSSSGWGSPVNAYVANGDAFAAKLNTSGVLEWHTFLGGTDFDRGIALAVDANGDIYVSGESEAAWGSPKNSHAALADVFVARLDTNGAFQWNTFLGGAGNDWNAGIALDGSGNIYVVGESSVPWGSPIDPLTIGNADGFAAKLDSSGVRQWNTFMGGSGYDGAYGITVDGKGNLYVVGLSEAAWGSPVAPYNANEDAFVANLSDSGERQWNTFMGGQGYDAAYAILQDGRGNLYTTGESNAAWGTPVNAYAGYFDAFVTKLKVYTFPWPMFLPAITGNARR